LAAKCRINVKRDGPSHHEIRKNLIGGSSMLNKEVREFSADVLEKIGIIQK